MVPEEAATSAVAWALCAVPVQRAPSNEELEDLTLLDNATETFLQKLVARP